MTLKFPFVTEKAMVLLENQSKLQFLVTNEASKGDIAPQVLKEELDRWNIFPEYEDRFLSLFRK